MDDAQLLARARSWEMEALAEIYDRYSPLLYRYAMRWLDDEILAEDCVAEVFSRFLYALHDGGGPRRHLKAYLFRMAHNWIMDHFRQQSGVALTLEETLWRDNASDVETRVLARQQQAKVRAALRRLTPEQQQVIVLRFLEGWSHAEIAVLLRKSVGAVKALQHRALAALRRHLREEEGLDEE